MKYDVIIVGASFAGLAVTSQIKSGRVLLIDQKEIGKEGKSACGTVLYKMKELGLEEAVLQVHDKIFLHFAQSTLKYPLFSPFCVIDYQKLCLGLWQRGKAKILIARVERFDGKTLTTEKGNFSAKIFVDASGPAQKKFLSFGLETILPFQEKGLHFWYEPKIFPKGIFWLFPQGKVSGFGVGSYQEKTHLKPYLDEFLTRFGLKAGKLHGGYFSHRLIKPVEGKSFRVGDAAGQCLPLTGEGIRPAIVFGQKLGEIIEEILKGEITLEAGLKIYRDFISRRKLKYEIMYFGQRFFTGLPEILFYPFAWLASKKPVTDSILKNYLAIIEGR